MYATIGWGQAVCPLLRVSIIGGSTVLHLSQHVEIRL